MIRKVNFKKLGILSLALVLSLGITACGKKADNASEEKLSQESVMESMTVSEESSMVAETSTVSQEASMAESQDMKTGNNLESFMNENPDIKKMFDDQVAAASNSETDASMVVEGNTLIMKFTVKEKWSDEMLATGKDMLKASFESEAFKEQANLISESFKDLGVNDVKVKVLVVQPDDTEILTVECN